MALPYGNEVPTVMDEEEWGPARVQFGDCLGTAAMDEDGGPLEGLLPDDWSIVGLELYGGTEGSLPGREVRPRVVTADHWAPPENRLYVLAVRSKEWQLLNRGDGIAPGQRVEVTRFLVHTVDGIDVLRSMTRWSIRFTRRGALADANVVVTAQGDMRLPDEPV